MVDKLSIEPWLKCGRAIKALEEKNNRGKATLSSDPGQIYLGLQTFQDNELIEWVNQPFNFTILLRKIKTSR